MDIDSLAAIVTAPLADLSGQAAIVGAAAVTLSLAVWGLGFLVRKGKGLAR